MSSRRHSVADPGAGRLAAVLRVGRVATGAPGGQGAPNESSAQVNEELLEQMHSELLRIHRPCLSHLSRTAGALTYFLKQLATNLSTVEDGRAAVASPTAVANELEEFQTVWKLLMDHSFPDDTFEQVANETADTLDRFTKQETCRDTLLRFMTNRMHRFCMDYGIDASTAQARAVEKSVDLLSTVGNDGQFRASSTEVMDVGLGLVEQLYGLDVMITHTPSRDIPVQSVMDLPDGKYESAMQALSDAMKEIRQFVEEYVRFCV